jgi:TGF-beta propeptide
MKNLRTQLAILLLFALCSLTGTHAQITPLGDTYTNSADPTTNYGAATLLYVDGATEAAYIQFNLSSIPTGASVSQAMLKLYVNAVTTAGSFEVYSVGGAWTESTLTYDLAQSLSLNSIVPSVALTAADKNQYILIPITSTVQEWVNTPSSNNGIALAASGPFNATFDSKENAATSHPAELDIVFAGGGTITGVTTTAGSGLTGGGTSGTLNLSLLTSCGSGQVLQWDGAAWLCASAGTGTITGVTAGTDLTGGGTSGNVTLNLNTANVPLLAADNTFTGNQTVNGNLTARGVVTGNSYQIGSNLFDYGSYANSNAFLGFAGNTTMTGVGNTASGENALFSNTTGGDNAAFGLYALASNTMGGYNTAIGGRALSSNVTGIDNTATGLFALLFNTTGNQNTALGYSAGKTADGSHGIGSENTAIGMAAAFGTGTLMNATAIGANAEVSESNALVLGSINDLNGATASVSVGIGTTSPTGTLDVVDNGSGGNTISATTSAKAASAVFASNTATSGNANGGFFNTYSPAGSAVVGINYGSGGGVSSAGYFQGNVNISGNLTKGGGSFMIDHPLDPANKYLYHSFVESPDMMNIYNGVVTLDGRGSLWITLPEYFEALNQDFRYQLTSIGRPQPNLYVAREIAGSRFRISGGKPGGRVSWQVTGIRHDAYADAHRIQVEVEKTPQEQGRYLHPELFGAPAEQAIGYVGPPDALPTEGEELAPLQERR